MAPKGLVSRPQTREAREAQLTRITRQSRDSPRRRPVGGDGISRKPCFPAIAGTRKFAAGARPRIPLFSGGRSIGARGERRRVRQRQGAAPASACANASDSSWTRSSASSPPLLAEQERPAVGQGLVLRLGIAVWLDFPAGSGRLDTPSSTGPARRRRRSLAVELGSRRRSIVAGWSTKRKPRWLSGPAWSPERQRAFGVVGGVSGGDSSATPQMFVKGFGAGGRSRLSDRACA